MAHHIATFVISILAICRVSSSIGIGRSNSETILIQRRSQHSKANVTNCCSQCGGRSFCSPKSGTCYDWKSKDYYRSCDSSAVKNVKNCCANCGSKGFCSPNSGNCYDSKSKEYYTTCDSSPVENCCTRCGGKPFCSPNSGNCYHSKNKEYYTTCGIATEGNESLLSDTPRIGSAVKIAKLKPDLECAFGSAEHIPGGGQKAVEQNMFDLLVEGYGIVGIKQAEYKLKAPSDDKFFFVGSMCKRSWMPYGDPVVIIFRRDMFDFVKSIGASHQASWSEMPYVSMGDVDKRSSADGCTADPNAHGERGYAGAVVKHKHSQKQMCVIVGTLAHGGPWNLRDQFYDELEQAGCNSMPIVFSLDANWEGHVKDFDRHNAWGSCIDPGRHYVYKNFDDGNTYVASGEASTCLRQHCRRYDRIALCNSPSGDLTNYFLDEFVCKAKGEHAPSKAEVFL